MSKSKRYDFTNRKSIHFHMTKDIHKEFKKRLFDDEITMQEFFEECAIRIVEDDAYMLKLIERLQQKRIEKEKRVYSIEADSIYDAIEKK